LALLALFSLRLISSGGRSLQEDRLSQIHVSNSGESGKRVMEVDGMSLPAVRAKETT
jgi:hypothetical protein